MVTRSSLKLQPKLFPPTIVWRHRKENLKKCSLRGLEDRSDFHFISYPTEELPVLDEYVILQLEAPTLSEADAERGLLIIDGTWRYAGLMGRQLANRGISGVPRSLPAHYRTAYPRYQNGCPLPDQGLASIEALYVAYHLLGRDTEGLLTHYHWASQFLAENFSENNK